MAACEKLGAAILTSDHNTPEGSLHFDTTTPSAGQTCTHGDKTYTIGTCRSSDGQRSCELSLDCANVGNGASVTPDYSYLLSTRSGTPPAIGTVCAHNNQSYTITSCIRDDSTGGWECRIFQPSPSRLSHLKKK